MSEPKLIYKGKEYPVLSVVKDCDGFPIGAVIKVNGDRKVLDDEEFEWKAIEKRQQNS